MATVRFSDDLRSDIRRNAERLFDGRMQAARETGADEWPRVVAEHYILTVNNLLGNVPQVIRERFLTYGKALVLDKFKVVVMKDGSRGFSPDSIGQETYVDVGHRVDMPIPMPNKESKEVAEQLGFISYERNYHDNLSVILDGSDPKWADLCAKAVKRDEDINAIAAERDTFVQNVQTITNSYSTLAPALKAWPPLWDLVPEQKQRKHKEIVERRRTTVEDVVGGMNLDQMTATTVASKLRR